MKIRFTKAPTFTKGIIAAAIFTIIYLASTSNLPSCSDTLAVLSSGSGACIERQSFLHTASGWLALICLIAAVLLLIIKHRVTIIGWQAQLRREWSAQATPSAQYQPQAQQQPQTPAPVPGHTSNFCAKCGTRIITGDSFCQSCGASVESP
jgi:zinc-ribbon domain